MKLQRSRFFHVYQQDDVYCLFNSLTQKFLFANQQMFDLLNEFERAASISEILIQYSQVPNVEQYVSTLIDYDLLVPFRAATSSPATGDPKDKVLESYRKPIFDETRYKVMYLIPADDCNFDCDYCYFYADKPENYVFGEMSPETADAAVDFFADLARSQRKMPEEEYRVVFYGGEPLLNKEIVYRAVKRLTKHETEGAFSPGMLTIVLVTNGSLVDDEFAKFAYDHGISVSVSLDGLETHHNQMRLYSKDGIGTYESAVAGLEKLVSYKCNPSPTITIGEHNIDDIEDIVKYYVEKYNCPISINIPMETLDDFGKRSIPHPRLIAEKMVNVFVYLREKGIYEDKIMRYVKSFITRQPRLYDCCGGVGEQFVVAPDGMIGPCQAMLTTRTFFNQNIHQDPDIFNDPDWNNWKRRSHFMKETCLNCEALAICGGGCPYISLSRKGDLKAVDDRICDISKYVQEWLVWDVYDQME